MVAAGADAVEVGIPFSDPMMDGPVIQEAALRALAAGHRPRRGARRHRPGRGPGAGGRHDVLQHRLPGRAPADGPLPGRRRRQRRHHPRPSGGGARALGGRGRRRRGRTRCCSSPRRARADRVERICERARGFVYAVARMGVTGERGDARRRRAPGGRAHPAPHRHAGLRRASACPRPRRRPRCARWPTASWSARPWSAACSQGEGPEARPHSWGRCARGDRLSRPPASWCSTDAARARCPAGFGCAARHTKLSGRARRGAAVLSSDTHGMPIDDTRCGRHSPTAMAAASSARVASGTGSPEKNRGPRCRRRDR